MPADAPEPEVVEVDGSTVDARWIPVAEVRSGRVDTVPLVPWALDRHATARMQRVAAKVVVRRGGSVLLTRNSARGPRPGTWTLPGGGVDHGEAPADAAVREVAEETGLVATLDRLLGVHDEHFTGTAPHGREEDFHARPPAVRRHGRSGGAGRRRVGGHHRPRRVGAGRGRQVRRRPGDRGGHRWPGDRPPTNSGSCASRSSPTVPPDSSSATGAADEIGYDLAPAGVRRVLVVTDPGVAATGHPARSPTRWPRTASRPRLRRRPRRADRRQPARRRSSSRAHRPWDAYVAVGGGSAIDTAKAVNLLATNDGDLMDYVNAPVGAAAARSGRCKPLVAVPTTTGTGSESRPRSACSTCSPSG